MSARLPVVTLDGPAGVGKTTLARRVAEGLGLSYLDTGAMFRCMALKLGAGAEALPEEKNAISHRGNALVELREKLSKC